MLTAHRLEMEERRRLRLGDKTYPLSRREKILCEYIDTIKDRLDKLEAQFSAKECG